MDEWMTRCSKSSPSRLDLQETHGRAFNIEDAHRVAAREKIDGGPVVDRAPVSRIERQIVFAYVGHGIPHHGKGAVPEEINLHEAGLLRPVLVPGYHPNAVARLLDGDMVGQPVGNDDETAGMGAEVPG